METNQQNIRNNGYFRRQANQENILNKCLVRNVQSEDRPKLMNSIIKIGKFYPPTQPSTSIEPMDLTSHNPQYKKFVIPNGLSKENIPPQIALQSSVSYLQNLEDRKAEILSAAKSLFSKRTRTLYHWMYPNVPKPQLKEAVAVSWEKLQSKEKEFYISQVLGRFGFSSSHVIVNPQLNGIKKVALLPPLDLTKTVASNSQEANDAVLNLLLSEECPNEDYSWMVKNGDNNISSASDNLQKKRKRSGRPPGSKNKAKVKKQMPDIKQLKDDDLFENDPELHREFEQFKFMMSFNNSNTPFY